MLRRRSNRRSQGQDKQEGEEIPMRPTSLWRRSKKPRNVHDESSKHQSVQADDSVSTDFNTSRVFYIPPHNGLTKTVKVFPVSSDTLSAPMGTEAFKSKATSICQAYKNLSKEAKENNAGSAYLKASKPKWYQRTLTIALPLDGQTEVAEWRGGAFSSSKNTITFPPDSPHCSHTITQSVDSFWKFREKFVVDSVPYLWVCNKWTMLDFSLFKMVGGEKKEVARYWQGFKWLQTSGILGVDESEIDCVVAVVTCLVVLRKKRQKDEERKN